MYHQRAHHGGSPAFWNESWNTSDFFQALRFCEIDPLRPLFERYARPGTSMLEGGCGLGHYLAYYVARGVCGVGIDFAHDTLARLRTRAPSLMLCVGNVATLPFRDKSFDLYYSGGVVEHFEAGADSALHEARRVLRPDGVLMISVPYFSPLRHVLFLMRNDWRRASHPGMDDPDKRGHRQFFQYAYCRREFKGMLEAAGFRVISTQGYAIIWGLYELPFVKWVATAWEQGRKTIRFISSSEVVANAPLYRIDHKPPAVSMLKRLVMGEDASVSIAGLVVRALRWACANMMMYVCVCSPSR